MVGESLRTGVTSARVVSLNSASTASAAAKLPYIGPHGLRHSYGTDMMRAGVAPRVVQERLGHSSVTITLDLYSHPDTAMHRAVADTIERPPETEIVTNSFPKSLNK